GGIGRSGCTGVSYASGARPVPSMHHAAISVIRCPRCTDPPVVSTSTTTYSSDRKGTSSTGTAPAPFVEATPSDSGTPASQSPAPAREVGPEWSGALAPDKGSSSCAPNR